MWGTAIMVRFFGDAFVLDFQSFRMGCRSKPSPHAKASPVHTINGSGVAVGRSVYAGDVCRLDHPLGSVVCLQCTCVL